MKMEKKYYDLITLFLNTRNHTVVIYRDNKFKIINDLYYSFTESGLNFISIYGGLKVDDYIIYTIDNAHPIKLHVEAFINRLNDDNNLHLIEEFEKFVLMGDI